MDRALKSIWDRRAHVVEHDDQHVGAFAGSRLTSFLGEYTDCAIVGPALLPDAFGGKGRLSWAKANVGTISKLLAQASNFNLMVFNTSESPCGRS